MPKPKLYYQSKCPYLEVDFTNNTKMVNVNRQLTWTIVNTLQQKKKKKIVLAGKITACERTITPLYSCIPIGC